MSDRISKQYKDSTAVVIGAGGIGSAIAGLLAESAARIVVADCDERALARLSAAHGPEQLTAHRLDVRDADAVGEFFQSVKAAHGAAKFLFYTAGILNVEPLSELTCDGWDRAIGVNLSGAFYCVQAVAEQMRVERQGSILILGSIAGTKGRSGSRVNPVYNATKAGLAAFVNAAAIQLRSHGVRINCISPGPTATTMMALQPGSVHAAVSEIMLDGRMNTATEVAELALFVAGHGRFTGEDVGLGGGAGLGG